MLWTYLPLKLQVIHQRKCKQFKSYANLRVTIVNKGLEIHLARILTVSTCHGVSQNKNFLGQTPSSMMNLTKVESLGLSKNRLSGEIPRQLTSLTFLAVMNLSCNPQLRGLL
ncbi:hypothetical protein NC651_009902 [Populus alba x Populus x berolinensis]|nr:hypothetical protein NC651_009902 [Populus alba x Populus x berolinensis]